MFHVFDCGGRVMSVPQRVPVFGDWLVDVIEPSMGI